MLKCHVDHRRVRSKLLLGAAAVVFLPLSAYAQQKAENIGGLETIVVTAQKRAENLQVVPVAVTALTSQTLANMRFENLGNLSAAAPGVSVRTGPGGAEAPNVTIRGIYGSGTFASDPGIALYIDGL